MRDVIASLVHPVLINGLRLKERVEGGEEPDLAKEQASLKGLLLSDEARRVGEFAGESSESSVMASRSGASMTSSRRAEQFLGIRYVLVCWLDEIFTVDAPASWNSAWNEAKMEAALYGTNDRAWQFWEQARLAETRTGSDALEVFFLCVMLGFRGDLRDNPEKLRSWAEGAKGRIAQQQGGEWPAPPGNDPVTNVPPLYGRERLQQMLLVAAGFVLLIIPVLAFLVVKQLIGS